MADLDTEGNLKSLIRARPGKPELAAQCIAAFWHCKCLLWVTTGLPVRRSYVSFRRVRTWSAREHRKTFRLDTSAGFGKRASMRFRAPPLPFAGPRSGREISFGPTWADIQPVALYVGSRRDFRKLAALTGAYFAGRPASAHVGTHSTMASGSGSRKKAIE
jgi:hypothetical protein